MQGSVYMQVYILAFLSDPHLDIAIDATARCSLAVSREVSHTLLCTCKGVQLLEVNS